MSCLLLSCVFQLLAYPLQASLMLKLGSTNHISHLLSGYLSPKDNWGLERNEGLFLNVCLLVAACVAPARLLHPNSSNWLQFAVLPVLQKPASSHCLWFPGIGWLGWACQRSEHELPSTQLSESQLQETRPLALSLCFSSPRETHCFLFVS